MRRLDTGEIRGVETRVEEAQQRQESIGRTELAHFSTDLGRGPVSCQMLWLLAGCVAAVPKGEVCGMVCHLRSVETVNCEMFRRCPMAKFGGFHWGGTGVAFTRRNKAAVVKERPLQARALSVTS